MPRTREFNPDKVVEQSMDVFWRKGYLATSLQDLVDETGVNRASLYATFEDKHTLFLKSLDLYRDAMVSTLVDPLDQPDGGLAAIRGYFETVVDDLLGPARNRGCLMINSATELAPHDPEVARHFAAHLARLNHGFTVALGVAAERGEIANPSSVAGYARFLTSSAQGLTVVGKANPDRAALTDIVELTLRALT